MTTGPNRATRDAVLGRANYRCERCGFGLSSLGYSLQHRIARGMGGTRGAWINSPCNLAVLCGSATTFCHGIVERRRKTEYGWWLNRTDDPSIVPVTLWDGRRVVLTDYATYIDLAA
jgi:hypothetical protein